MSKKVLAAGIVRDLEFDSADSYDLYMHGLFHRKVEHQVIEEFACSDGRYVVRILCNYNHSPLIQLFVD